MKGITYGTFGLFYEGHVRLLEQAKALGDHLTVGVTTENYDDARGKLNVQQSLTDRIRNVQDSGLADEVIIEAYEGQKVNDLQKCSIDVFAIGSDWQGKFEYLRDYCKIVYLEPAKGISSTALRAANFGILKLGAMGTGRIAKRFLEESHFVSGVHVEACTAARRPERKSSVTTTSSSSPPRTSTSSWAGWMPSTSPPGTNTTSTSLCGPSQPVSTWCAKPLTLSVADTQRLHETTDQHDVVLLEAAKTAYSPGFQHLVAVARNGSIGDIKSVGGTFTKLVGQGRELKGEHGGQRLGASQLPPAGNPKAARARPPGCAPVLADGRGGRGRPLLTHTFASPRRRIRPGGPRSEK